MIRYWGNKNVILIHYCLKTKSVIQPKTTYRDPLPSSKQNRDSLGTVHFFIKERGGGGQKKYSKGGEYSKEGGHPKKYSQKGGGRGHFHSRKLCRQFSSYLFT